MLWTTLKDGIRILLLLLLFMYFGHQSKAQNQATVSTVNQKNHKSSEEYKSLTFNGSWCWFSDPRAVYYEGIYKRTYTGWIDNYGDIHVAYYDHDSQEIQSKVIYDDLEIDDHDNPSLLFDESGRLMVFFNKHTDSDPLYLIKALEPENIEFWAKAKNLYLNDPALKDMGSMSHTYTNPVKLSDENGRIYLFWRGVDGKPCYSFSDDNGESWSKGVIYFMPERLYSFRRPYVKISSNGRDKIHFTLTDGHPRNEVNNNIYYMYYKAGAFYKADGTLIKTVENLPISPNEIDKAYDGKSGQARAWNWDVAENEKGNPVIAFARYPDESKHIYSYAIWTNGAWKYRDLVNSGRWFPETKEGQKEMEPHYSGGMSLDHENPDKIYLSVNRGERFEIEEWITEDEGDHWSKKSWTQGSSKNNIRPFAIRGAKEGNPIQFLWMQNSKYLHYRYGYSFKTLIGETFKNRFHSSIKMNALATVSEWGLQRASILEMMHKVADWQLSNPYYENNRIEWQYGAFYTGVQALYDITKEDRYRAELINIGQRHNWQPRDQIFYADQLVIMDTWAWLYAQLKHNDFIDKGKWVMDIHLARRYQQATDVRFKDNPYFIEWWTWCDALFMAPPSFAKMSEVTGEDKYLKYAKEQWWKTSDYLFSETDSLYYRDDRYFDKRSENGKKIFWSRGNGWVLAGLARMLEYMPQDDPDRAKFELQYKKMAHKLLRIQGKDYLWIVSLHDPEYINIGESSGSAFYTFALAWGINNGLIDDKYKEQVQNAWLALCNNVNKEGRLGYVQRDAADPYPFYEDQWHVYASGAFLLAGKQMYLMDK